VAEKEHSMTMGSAPEAAASSPARRRAATPRVAAASGRKSSKGWTILLVIMALIVGVGVGAFLMRQRMWGREVVAAVNGVLITKDDLFRRMQVSAGTTSLQQLVSEELQMQYATKIGAVPPEAEVEAKYQEATKEPNFRQTLAATHMTPADFKRNLRRNLARISVVNRGVTVTDADVRKFYEENIDKKNPKARFYLPEAVQVAVIVTATRDKAEKALEEIKKGMGWETVVNKYSQDSSKARGGALPPVVRGRAPVSKQMPELENALFSMKIGDRIGPRQFGKAWWIIQCLDKSGAVTKPFEKVKEECRTGAMLLKGLPANADKIEKDFTAFREKAKLQVFWATYENAIKKN
jgi:parvulin-like peptidyl-prolyl isomerase